MSRAARAFGIKDVFSLINLAGGVAAVLLCVALRNTAAAGLALLLGYLLGDALDGPIARWTGTTNRFGKELDNVCDHLTQCIAPATVVFVGYRPFFSQWLTPNGAILAAGSVAFVLVATGSIRHARGAVASFTMDNCWNGMPRTVSGFLALTVVNSHVFGHTGPYRWLGLVVILACGVLNITPVPYTNHHGRWTAYPRFTRAIVAMFLSTLAGSVAFARGLVWDVLLLWMVLYSGLAWLGLTREERKEFFVRSRVWREAIAAAK
jgi:CDP-diacylglycerol--serine O-phosphatidyltransferase